MYRWIALGVGAMALLPATPCMAQPYYYQPPPGYVAPPPNIPPPAFYGAPGTTSYVFGFYNEPYAHYHRDHHHYDWGYWHGRRGDDDRRWEGHERR